jgi:hypothetical protein
MGQSFNQLYGIRSTMEALEIHCQPNQMCEIAAASFYKGAEHHFFGNNIKI